MQRSERRLGRNNEGAETACALGGKAAYTSGQVYTPSEALQTIRHILAISRARLYFSFAWCPPMGKLNGSRAFPRKFLETATLRPPPFSMKGRNAELRLET